MEPVEYLDTERGRRDVNGPAVLRVMTTLGEPEADHAIDECARRTQCALLHARDLVHGRTAGRGAQLLQRTDLVPGDRPELARQLFRHAGHEPALQTADVTEQGFGGPVPADDGSIEPSTDNSVLRRLHDRCQQSPGSSIA